MRSVMKTLFPALAGLILGGCATSTPLQVAVFDPVQAFDRRHDVNGLRLNCVYGNNENVRGLDVGFVNVAQKQMAGIQLGALASYSSAEDLYGMQISAGLVDVNRARRMRGIQFVAAAIPFPDMVLPSGANNAEEEMRGMQLAPLGMNIVGKLDTNHTSRA